MADRLDMGQLSLNDSQHALQPNGFTEKSAYIPPHLRNSKPLVGGQVGEKSPEALNGNGWPSAGR